jgi:hypothetical protein
VAARARSSELTRVTGARCFDEIWEQMVKCIRTTGVIEKCRSPTSQKLADNTVAFSGRIAHAVLIYMYSRLQDLRALSPAAIRRWSGR